jgi:flagellar motor switch/type III secretory pathway protein FliN
MLKTHLPSPSLVPETSGHMRLELKLGTVCFSQNAVLNESIELLHNGRTIALGKLIREGKEVYVELVELV